MSEGALCLRTRQIDEALVQVDEAIDWLGALSPTNNAQRWRAFEASGFRTAPPLTYPEVTFDCEEIRCQLHALPLDEVEVASVAALLREKARELEGQADLVSLRGKDGFIAASIECFGAPSPHLVGLARTILSEVGTQAEPEEPSPEAPLADADAFVAAAQRHVEAYREQAPDFAVSIEVVDDLNSGLMVNHGDLLVDRRLSIPADRVEPLVAHELGTHVITRYNGRHQPLRQLETGLAGYDALQEGLGALAEYLVGGLPRRRLRVLAARVIAAEAAVQRTSLEEIFALLHEEYGVDMEDAFDIAVRAKRGGGLTKDACYLEGLDAVLEFLEQGHDVESLFIGKFALSHLSILKGLRDDGIIVGPVVLPHHMTSDLGRRRLQALCTRTIHQLCDPS